MEQTRDSKPKGDGNLEAKDAELAFQDEEEEQVETLKDPERPRCPQCGWHNTRLSHTRTFLDPLLGIFSLRAFRCRTCGNRFRAVRRNIKA